MDQRQVRPRAGLKITIDGPAGSGKSTAARKLAARLEIPYLDTGAMYRVVTLAALRDGASLTDEQTLADIAASSRYELDLGSTYIRVTLDGHDVTEHLRTMEINDHTRFIAASPAVRAVLVRKQQEIGRRLGELVTEGRDQGSVAFPDAQAKFYLDAAPQRRAERRYHELVADGERVSFAEVLANVRERDRTDSARAVAPLVVPRDAILIDTSDLSVHEVVNAMIDHLQRAGLVELGG